MKLTMLHKNKNKTAVERIHKKNPSQREVEECFSQ